MDHTSALRPLRPGGINLVLASCFLLSGFAGLCYEICWIRKASLVFGATTLAVSTVTAVFFAGLALGSYLFGRYSRTLARPLRCYALLELGLGGLALGNPELFARAEEIYRSCYSGLMGSVALLALARMVLVAVVILPPTIVMGATLPLFCRHFVASREKISLPVALLYGVNTLGATAGAAFTGFLLIPAIGVDATIRSAALLNLIAGLITCAVQSRIPASAPEAEPALPEAGPPGAPGRQVRIVAGLFFLTGFVALANEVLLVRYLSLLIHNSVYTYTLTLTVTLAGIVVGSLFISGIGDRTRLRAFIFGLVQIAAALTVWMLVMLPAAWWQGVMGRLNSPSHLWIFLILLLLPAVLSGISFPLAVRMALDHPSLAGARVGKLYACNTMGGIAGSLAAGFVLLPHLGLQRSFLMSAGLGILIGSGAWLLLDRAVALRIRGGLIACAFSVWLAIPLVTGTRLPADFLHTQDQELVDYHEGYGADLAVTRFSDNNETALEIDRMWQGNNLKNQQIMAAHVPMLLHPDPKRALVVGVGVGKTASRFLFHDLTRLDCVDIEPGLFDIIRRNFDSSWMRDPRVRLITEDGRNYLSNTDASYDLISIEVGQTFRPGIASFYTLDFYRRLRDRLAPGGLVSQFVPINFLDLAGFRSVVRTFVEVFPGSILWYNSSELLLIGGNSGAPALSPGRLAALGADGPLRRDLRYTNFGGPEFYLNRPEVFLAGFLCGPQGLAELTTGAEPYRDDLPRLEYGTTGQGGSSVQAIVDQIARHLAPPGSVSRQALDRGAVARVSQVRGLNLNDLCAASLVQLWTPRVERNDLAKLGKAVALSPYNLTIRLLYANALALQGDTVRARQIADASLRIDPDYRVSRELGRIF